MGRPGLGLVARRSRRGVDVMTAADIDPDADAAAPARRKKSAWLTRRGKGIVSGLPLAWLAISRMTALRHS